MAVANASSAHHMAMMEACKEGDIARLQQLWDQHSTESSNDPARNSSEIWELFVCAFSHGHPSVLEYLHFKYPDYNLADLAPVWARREKLDLDMLKLLYSYNPEVVTYEYGDHTTSLLSVACEGGPNNAPIVDWLLDHGASAGGYTYHFGEALVPALQHDQPIEIIRKMVPRVARLSLPIYEAIKQKRTERLEILLDADLSRRPSNRSLQYLELLRRQAQDTEDKKVIALVEHYIECMEQQTTKDSRQARKPTKREVAVSGAQQSHDARPKENRRWWQFRALCGVTKGPDTEDSSSETTRVESSNSWWPLSKSGSKPKSMD